MDNEKDKQSLELDDLDKVSGGYVAHSLREGRDITFCDRCGRERVMHDGSKDLFFHINDWKHLCSNCVKELKNELGEDIVKDILRKKVSYVSPAEEY